MKVSFDPTIEMRKEAKRRMNVGFNNLAAQNLHTDHAYAHKRAVAKDIKRGSEAPSHIVQEAALRGISLEDLADLILSKPNIMAERELLRQQMSQRIEQASFEELSQFLKEGFGD